MNPDHCLIERTGHVLVVTLNRPEAKNALSPGMLAGMYKAWRRLDDDPELRCAVLTGRGDVFCAGADLKAMGAGDVDDEFLKLMSEVPDIHWQALLRHNRPLKPIIAAVEGFARLEKSESPVFTTSHCVVEVVSVFASTTKDFGRAARAGREILDWEIEIVRPSPTEERRALALMETYADSRVSYVDCLSFVAMDARGARTAFTFDAEHFVKLRKLKPWVPIPRR